jgi:hypothetical protein
LLKIQKGEWKDAADRLRRTDWAKQYPDAANSLIERLKNIKDKMRKD